MGDPKLNRRKYSKPAHPWQSERIQNENDYIKYYGLKNKREFWKARASLKSIRGKARNLQARLRYGEKQAKKEMDEFIDKMSRKGYIVGEEVGLNDILNMTIENILNRRLQTLVYHKGLAHSPGQARQFISHGHIMIRDRKITVPSYVVSREEESQIDYNDRSPLSDELHPERPEEERIPEPIPKQMKKEKERNDFRGGGR